jgi:hypothetical protein
VIDGPQNYMGNLYRAVPVGITVEGANILTRNLIVFGQGAIRAHPYLLQEMNALGDPDKAKGLEAFDTAFWKHIGHSVTTLFRAWGRCWTGGVFAPAPDAGDATQFYRQLSRYSSAFALCADMALLTLGGALKRKEMLSARFGDILSELYLLSAALKRWEDEGRVRHWRDGLAKNLLSPDEIAALTGADEAVAAVIAVDDFAAEDLSPRSLETIQPAAKRSRAKPIAEPSVLAEPRTFGAGGRRSPRRLGHKPDLGSGTGLAVHMAYGAESPKGLVGPCIRREFW